MPAVRESNGRVRFSVRVQPRAARSEVVGVHGDAIKIRLSSPPVDGAANDELVIFLAEIFAVPRRAVRILAGETSRSKLIEIDGVTAQAVHDIARATER
jgi:TIGR00251 family protein